MNANSRCRESELENEDVNMTALVAHNGFYRYTKMTSSFENAPTTFTKAFKLVVATILGQYAFLYIEQVTTILSKTPAEHLRHFEEKHNSQINTGKKLKSKSAHS